MFLNKVNQISDPIHGSIQISQFEKGIISTQIFNRLHHVLQNSTVFMTFPSNKTSRFAHSLGVMYLGGEMFKYSIINASMTQNGRDIIHSFFNHVKLYLTNLLSNQDFSSEGQHIFVGALDYNTIFSKLNAVEQCQDPFYELNTPFSIPKELYYTYIVTFQALRCTALLHDLGHPPFSHITENAINKMYSYVHAKQTEGTNLTSREQSLLRAVGSYSGGKLHEQLGNHLTKNIFNLLIKDCPTKDKKAFCLHVKYITLAILNEQDDIFKALHKIVDGVIDCDRLDYVSRDPIASGFNDGVIEYERIIKTMKLAKDKEKYIFCPSASALNTIEDFLKRRWKMYKYIIRHHRVVKTDTLLAEVIEALAKEYIEDQTPDNEPTDYRIESDISGLWKTIDKNSNLTDGDYVNHLIQWDDAWLLACLRSAYFKRIADGKNNDILTAKLEELLSNKKKYMSLYKRLDGFEQLDSAIIEQFNLSALDSLATDNRVNKDIELIEKYKTDLEKREKHNYPLVQLYSNLQEQFFTNLGKIASLDKLLKDALTTVGEKYGVKDSILKRNDFNTGIDGSAKIYYKEEVYSLESYSRIKVELMDDRALVPPYFIYLFSESHIPEQEFRLDLGKEIARKVEAFIRQTGEEKK
ncbi:MAG: hypothetical protein ABFC57_04815 [Veillonellales bacterium]